MPDFQIPDVGALQAALKNTPLELPPSEKGRYFKDAWWPKHHADVEGPVLKAISREGDPAFDRRVNIMRIALDVDNSNGKMLTEKGFTPTEITRYVTRAINRRLKSVASGPDGYYVIRNQKLMRLQLEHIEQNPAE